MRPSTTPRCADCGRYSTDLKKHWCPTRSRSRRDRPRRDLENRRVDRIEDATDRLRQQSRHPEWAGYLAAFDSYVHARARDDHERADQARLLMGWFSDALLAAERLGGNRDTEDRFGLGEALDRLGLR